MPLGTAVTRAIGLVRLFPMAIPFVFILQAWLASGLHPEVLVRPLFAACLLSLVVIVGSTALAADADRGAILATSILMRLVMAARGELALALDAVVILLIVVFAARRHRQLIHVHAITRVTRYGVAIGLLSVLFGSVSSGAILGLIEDASPSSSTSISLSVAPAPNAPDIVVLLLDGFPGRDASEVDPTWDPNRLWTGLEDRGFTIPERRSSNYVATALTLASMFGMTTVDKVPALDTPGPTDADETRRVRRFLQNAAALDVMSAAGYELISADSGFDGVELRDVDRRVQDPSPSLFELHLLGTSGLGGLASPVVSDLLSSMQRDRIHRTFDLVPSLVNEPHLAPRFIFAHVPAPHAPWVFDANGGPVTEDIRNYYLDSAVDRRLPRAVALSRAHAQATYIGELALAAIDYVSSGTPRPVLIVLMSDHGSRTGSSWVMKAQTDLQESFGNVFAVRTPDGATPFGECVTPVQLFPGLFNTYLGTRLPMPTDSTWVMGSSILDETLVNPDVCR